MKEREDIDAAQLGISSIFQMTHSKEYQMYLSGVSDALEWVLGD